MAESRVKASQKRVSAISKLRQDHIGTDLPCHVSQPLKVSGNFHDFRRIDPTLLHGIVLSVHGTVFKNDLIN